jgi:hypothetical protein
MVSRTLAALSLVWAPIADDSAPAAPAALTARELIAEPPTLMALGLEWYVEGGDNGNAKVVVSYRRKCTATWRDALPLVHLDRDDHAGQYGPPVLPAERHNLLAGSLFALNADTDYEVRLVLSDPDGVRGRRERTVTARTRAEPRPAPGGRRDPALRAALARGRQRLDHQLAAVRQPVAACQCGAGAGQRGDRHAA